MGAQLNLLQLCAGEEGGAAVATVLDHIALEDCLTQGAWRDVGKSPGNMDDIYKRTFRICHDKPGGCGAPSLLQHVLRRKSIKKASPCGGLEDS